MNPTSKAFQKELDNVVSKASVDDVSSLRKIKIEGETDEATSSGSAGQFSAPLFSLFSDEAPKKKKVKGGVVETDESIEEEDKLEMIFELLDDFTSGGKLYYDDEEDSIWMINPETKEWIFEFKKSGNLWYSYQIFANIFKWLSMEYPDFVPYITKWVERILQTEVKNTYTSLDSGFNRVERILQTEVKNTFKQKAPLSGGVERILQSGNELNSNENINESVDANNEEDLEMVFELLDDFTSGGKLYYDDVFDSIWMINPETKQWIFEFKKSGRLWYSYPIFTNIFKWISMEYPDFNPYITKWVEGILQKEVKNTETGLPVDYPRVERILQSGTELNSNENINESIIDSEEDKLEMIFELLDDFTSNGKLYYDDVTESILMINPETKQWIFEFEKSGFLYYSYPIFVNIFKWISMEYPDFVPYITKWVERILQNEVKNTALHKIPLAPEVERILQNEVKNTFYLLYSLTNQVERILQKGNELNPDENINESVDMNNEEDLEMVFELLDDFTSGGKLYYDEEEGSIWMINPKTKQWIFEFEKSGDLYYSYPTFINIFKWISMEYPDFVPYIIKWVERILKKEVKNTSGSVIAGIVGVERILKKEVKNTLKLWRERPTSVERILQKEVKNTETGLPVDYPRVKRILQKGTELNPDKNINESVDANNEEDLEMIFELLDDFTSGGKLYYDEEEDSIWMINPKTKQWIFEFKKSGTLWYYSWVFTNIFKYISMEHPDFVPYITKWVERILQTEVKNTIERTMYISQRVERILQKGTELNPDENINESVVDSEEDKLEMIFELLDDFTSGGKLYYDDLTESIWMINPETKQWIFEFEKSGNLWYSYWVFTNIFKYISMEHPDFEPYIKKWVERILQNEVKNTYSLTKTYPAEVERILQNEVKNTQAVDFIPRINVERILQNEVKNTREHLAIARPTVERILQSGDELLIGGKSDKMSLEDISKKHNIKIGQLKKQFNMGLKIEKEHTNNEEVAKEITLDHLYEDPEYYTKLNKIEKGEFKEATGAASAGQYSGPSFLAKSQSKKDWRGAAKPLYKGGKFVRVKKKCKTFPYCNQGDIKALDLWEDDKLTETIKKIAKNKRVHENVIRAIILHEIEEKLFGD